ncbi:MAG: hypothetical protein EP329_02050 [Deltaproteobacteria bacterium]|nr:MAG: hypothetical protein EP329_02050 [Deltaproteobacteria bacterium]
MATRRKKSPQAQQELTAETAEVPVEAEESVAHEPVEDAVVAASEADAPATAETAPEAAPAPIAPTSSHPQQSTPVAASAAEEPPMNSEIPFVGPALEAAQSFWREAIERQLSTFEGAFGQVERFGQEQLDRAQARLDETHKIAQDALKWLAEVNTANARRGVELIRAAAAMFPGRAA